MEIQFWHNEDDKLITATVDSILRQLEDAEGVGEVSADEALDYYARTIVYNSKADFVVSAFKPLEKRLLEFFNNETITKAIDGEGVDG